MFSDSNTAKGEMYHQLHVDDGLKQILPYLVNWIQNEVGDGVICHLGPTDSENEAGGHARVSGVSDARDAQSGVESPSEHGSLRSRDRPLTHSSTFSFRAFSPVASERH